MRYLYPILFLLIQAALSGCGNKAATPDSLPGAGNRSSRQLSIETRIIDTAGKYAFAEKLLDPSKTAIIIVDMWHQGGHGYVKPDGGFEGTNEGYFYQERVSDSINETLCAARALGFIIVHAPAAQAYLYEGHPAREHIKRLARSKYPWSAKPEWNEDQKKIPFAVFPFEYEYAYPSTPKKPNRPGTLSYGQNPRIVIADSDYITDDVEELWNLLQERKIETLIYMGGSVNMCVAGRPYGLLNMKKYGKDVLLDRNYAHLVYRIPNGWNGDTTHPEYGPFYTNERNSRKVTQYFEQAICPTIDGMKIRELALLSGGYTVLEPPVKEAIPDTNDLHISFQTQLIEIEKGYITDIGWEYTKHPNGLVYGWNRLKVKDAIREGYRPVQSSFIKASPQDQWRMTGLPAKFTALVELSGSGSIMINDTLHSVKAADHLPIGFTGSRNIRLEIKSGGLKLYQVSAKAIQERLP